MSVPRAPSGREPLSEAEGYAELNRMWSGAPSLTTGLQALVDLVARMLPEQPAASFTVLEQDAPRTAASSRPVARHLDERQYGWGAGPCLDAARTGQTLQFGLAASYDLYPDFCEIGLRQGVTHAMSIGLPVAAPGVGALNLYSTAGRAFSSDAERLAGTVAGVAGLLLSDAGSYHRPADELASDLRTAVLSRARIEQAKGVLMAQRRIRAPAAFELLVRTAQQQSLGLPAAAELVLERAGVPSG